MLQHLKHASSAGKIEAAIEMAEEVIEEGNSVVLFTEFLDTADAVAGKLGAARITGHESDAMVEANKARFQSGKVKSIICTFARGGEGHTLHSANIGILIDRPWTPGGADQAADRLHRIGQERDVDIYWLQATDTDRYIDEILEQKSERIELVLKGKRSSMRGTGSIGEMAQELCKELFSK